MYGYNFGFGVPSRLNLPQLNMWPFKQPIIPIEKTKNSCNDLTQKSSPPMIQWIISKEVALELGVNDYMYMGWVILVLTMTITLVLLLAVFHGIYISTFFESTKTPLTIIEFHRKNV